MILNKYIYGALATVLVVFAGCSSDDNPGEKDPITGKWESVKQVFVYENTQEEISYSLCEQEGNDLWFFAEENSFLKLLKHNTREEGEDVCTDSILFSGTWGQTSEGHYKAEVTAYDKTYDPQQVTEDTLLFTVNFPTKDTLYVYDEERLRLYQEEDETVTDYYEVYSFQVQEFHTP